jgi:hypothetical protein
VTRDTSPEAMRMHAEAQRRLGPHERFRTACLMSQSLRDMTLNRIRASHPDFSEQEVIDQLLFELYGFRRNT